MADGSTQGPLGSNFDLDCPHQNEEMGDGPVVTVDNANSVDNVGILARPIVRRRGGAGNGRINDTEEDIVSVMKMFLVQDQRNREDDRQSRDEQRRERAEERRQEIELSRVDIEAV